MTDTTLPGAGLSRRGAALAGREPWDRDGPARPFALGHPALDAVLPGGGWPTGALTELLIPHFGVGELGLLLPQLRNIPAGRWAVCIAPPGLPYAPALAAAGVPLGRLLLVQAESPAHARWACRQALASRSCEIVLLWLAEADMAALRRLMQDEALRLQFAAASLTYAQANFGIDSMLDRMEQVFRGVTNPAALAKGKH